MQLQKLSGFFKLKANLRYVLLVENCIGWVQKMNDAIKYRINTLYNSSFITQEELGSNEGLERCKERAVCSNLLLIFNNVWLKLTNVELPNIFDLQEKWPTVSSMWSTINLKAFFAQVKNIQREKHGGGAGKDGGEARIQQVWTIHANFPILGNLAPYWLLWA